MLLGELGLSPLQGFCQRQTHEFWNNTAASPVGSLFHTILLDNLNHAYCGWQGAKNFSGSIATCLQSRLHDSDIVPAMEVGTVMEALHHNLAPMTMPCIVLEQPQLLELLLANTVIGFSLLASIGGTISYLFLVGACSAFCNLDLVLMNCQLCLAILLGPAHCKLEGLIYIY
jgi:hypothetical protein